MTQIQPLALEKLTDSLSYGGGLVRVYWDTGSIPSWATDHYLVGTKPIDVPPAVQPNPNGDDGSGLRPYWPIVAGGGGVMTCVTTPCVVPPIAPPPHPPHPRPKIGFPKSMKVWPQGQVLSLTTANSLAEVSAQVQTWAAGQKIRAHVYCLDTTSPGFPSLLASYVAIPVQDVAEAAAPAIRSFFT